MITQLFHQASVDLEGLEELIENTALSAQGSLIDTGEFLAELTAGRELAEKGYLVPPEEFNQFCLARNLQPRLVKRHLYAAGRIVGAEENGKINYSILVWIEGKPQRRIAVKPLGGRADGIISLSSMSGDITMISASKLEMKTGGISGLQMAKSCINFMPGVTVLLFYAALLGAIKPLLNFLG